MEPLPKVFFFIQNFTQLEELSWNIFEKGNKGQTYYSYLNDKCVHCISNLVSLKYLHFDARDISPTGIGFLRNLTKLEVLKLDYLSFIAPNILQETLTHLTNLHSISFQKGYFNAEFLPPNLRLVSLDLSHCPIVGEGNVIAVLSKFPCLKNIDLQGTTFDFDFLSTLQHKHPAVTIQPPVWGFKKKCI